MYWHVLGTRRLSWARPNLHLAPASPCQMLFLQAILCLQFCKAAALFWSFKADGGTVRRGKHYVYFLSKILLVHRLCWPKSFWFLSRWVEILNSLLFFPPSLARNTEPLNSPAPTAQTILPLKESNCTLLKLGPNSINYKKLGWYKGLFHRPASFR